MLISFLLGEILGGFSWPRNESFLPYDGYNVYFLVPKEVLNGYGWDFYFVTKSLSGEHFFWFYWSGFKWLNHEALL